MTLTVTTVTVIDVPMNPANALSFEPPPAPRQLGTQEEERIRRFGDALDLIRARTEAKVGEEDLAHVRRVEVFSRSMELLGRALIHISFEPISFVIGVGCLFLHKQLQATEIGHTALHGAYDKIPGAHAYQSKTNLS